ncbi:MAG: DUF1638 domain-containing protein [Coriobacteriales bacterium]|jgi:hypothetical protein|nr:DUF1638 domain-containing protein [Coriobacteriales bacterium]
MGNVLVVACHNIRNELAEAFRVAGTGFPTLFVPRNMHLHPDRLREYLQGVLDNLINVDTVLLPMGRCGNSTIGLHSSQARLVLPQCDDCIDIMLGDGPDAGRSVYSYYLTENWLGESYSIDVEYLRTIERFGAEKADSLMREIYQNYESFTFMDTGTYEVSDALTRIQPLADTLSMRVDCVSCSFQLLKNMLSLELEKGFIVLEPGEVVTEEHFRR